MTSRQIPAIVCAIAATAAVLSAALLIGMSGTLAGGHGNSGSDSTHVPISQGPNHNPVSDGGGSSGSGSHPITKGRPVTKGGRPTGGSGPSGGRPGNGGGGGGGRPGT
jgi:hypothetical protein